MAYLTEEQIKQIGKHVQDLPDLIKRMGKDGQQIEAFWQDANDLLKKAGPEEKLMVSNIMLKVMLVAKNCTRKFSWDPFKPLRLECDQVARILNFERYKKLRNL